MRAGTQIGGQIPGLPRIPSRERNVVPGGVPEPPDRRADVPDPQNRDFHPSSIAERCMVIS